MFLQINRAAAAPTPRSATRAVVPPTPAEQQQQLMIGVETRGIRTVIALQERYAQTPRQQAAGDATARGLFATPRSTVSR